MSASLPDGTLHLLVADEGLTEGWVYRIYLTLCHELVPASGLPPSLCPAECDREHRYCPACVREAARWSAEVGDRSAAPLPVAPDASAQAGQDDEPHGYFVGKCGHRVPLVGAGWHIGPCDDCDP